MFCNAPAGPDEGAGGGSVPPEGEGTGVCSLVLVDNTFLGLWDIERYPSNTSCGSTLQPSMVLKTARCTFLCAFLVFC